MASRTFSIKYGLMTSLLIEVNGFVSSVPATLLTIFLLVGSYTTKGNTPIFPEKSSFPCASNLGRANATKNMTFLMKFLLLQVRIGSSSSGNK